MRWPRRRKPEPPDDDHEFLRAIGWIDDEGEPIPSPERAKPETPQAKPITTVGGSQEWKARVLDALALHDMIRAALADATETIPNTQENTMPLPDQLAGITPHSTIEALADKLIETGRTARIRAEGSDTARVIHIDTDEPQPVHSPGWYRTMTTDAATERYGFPAPDCYPLEHTATDGSKWHLDQDGNGWTLTEYMDDDTHLLKAWEKAVLNGARALAAGEPGCHLIETGGTAPRGGHLRIIVDTETGEYDRMEAEWKRREAKLTAEPEAGSAAWLRDLADRIDTAREHVDAPNAARYLQSVVRRTADEVERDERQAAADTRDRERVEPILAARWAKDRDRQFLPSLVPTWDDLTDEERAHCIDYGLELYRAGRDDTVAAWQPGNGGGSGNPGTRGGQPAGQGGAHHA